jgi:hypothetical protein
MRALLRAYFDWVSRNAVKCKQERKRTGYKKPIQILVTAGLRNTLIAFIRKPEHFQRNGRKFSLVTLKSIYLDMSRPLYRMEEEIGKTYSIYHIFARFIVEESLVLMVRNILGVKRVWHGLEENHFGVAFDTETVMLRVKAALVRYVKENRID